MKWVATWLMAIAAMSQAHCAEVPPAAAHTMVAGAQVQGAEWFRQTGCTACHSISSYNAWNLTATGPDLTMAVEDVPRRFGVTLDEFLAAPTGTMAMVLSTRIPLTMDQRALAVAKLKEAYRRHREIGAGVHPVVSH